MDDQDHPPIGDAPDDSATKRPNIAYLPIGITFMMLGAVFMATLDSVALGLVFLPVGVVFIALSLSPGDAGGGGGAEVGGGAGGGPGAGG
ncbi:hypothetical protein [Yonghaparkia sp. Root332]|uniref:hypothetical protein n=1 Tax=Yonghaparkia sp. Root332 TaxID=1736516 RepID=UPI000700CAFA|nr:hypothetical protein [Yonghaparkia sp. Root332]KQV25228.1 hypothetical protein ASC54_12360 [Yonghaparkia sp. Root332]